MKHKVWILPHSHYDAEVFMVEKETLETGYANLIGALALLRSNPEFRFALDQTCLIEPFLKAYPEERETFQQVIAEGRLEITGGMYIMPDVNLPSGESFIRQVLAGKLYCEEELGVDVRCGWTIDTFGHHPQMPQLMLKCGFDHNTFQRLMPRGSPSEFVWQGIDGSRLFCHWMPRSYAVFWGSPGSLHEFRTFVEQRVRSLEQHAVTAQLVAPAGADLMPIDPRLLELVEAYNRSQDELELVFATPAECFRELKACGGFPTVTGDLNPVFQGCYSARIDIKQWNRKLENLLVTGEKLDALAHSLGSPSQAKRLEGAWRGVLFNQFHDIICGSHVDAVFEHTMDRFKASLAEGEACLENSLAAIAREVETRGEGIPVLVFNPLGWAHSDAVECTAAFSAPGTFELAVKNAAGQPVPCDLLQVERYPDGSIKRAKLLFIAREVPSLGYEVYRIVPAEGAPPETGLTSSHPYGGLLRFELDRGWMENEFYRLEIDLWSGVITSLQVKDGAWEVVDAGRPFANTVVKEPDFGNFWQYNGPCKGDAFYPLEGRYPLPELNGRGVDFAHTTHGDGNIRQGKAFVEFSISHPYGSGTFATRVRLYAGLPRIDFHTMLLNNDERVRYRAAFPTSLKEGEITYEIPFGAIQRPEGEFPAQNWIDVSDGTRGVALLNRGLPGNNVVEGVMMLSLLKCTALEGGYGDLKLGPATVQGFEKEKEHIFDYALIPHRGDWSAAQVVRRGAEFNQPLLVFKPARQPGRLPAKTSFLQIASDNVALSAVKAVPGGLIVRLYETAGRPAENVGVDFAWPARQAVETDLIEKELQALPLENGKNRVVLTFQPFEIKTIKIK